MSNETCVKLHARKRWRELWMHAASTVEAALRELVRSGAIPESEIPDLRQEAQLAVGPAVRRWDPASAAFTTYVAGVTRVAVLRYRATEGRHRHESLQDTLETEDGELERQELLAYEEPPEGYLVADEQLESAEAHELVHRAIPELRSARDRSILRAVYGIDSPLQSLIAYADARGVDQRTARNWLRIAHANLRQVIQRTRSIYG